MCYTNSELTAEKVSAIFTVKFSETGSNSRNIENRIFTFWNDFLLDCQGNIYNFYFFLLYIHVNTIPIHNYTACPSLEKCANADPEK